MRFNPMSEITCELRRPAKVVVWGWASLVLLFLVMAPFVDVPWTVFVLSGTLYSLFLVVFSTGLALLGTPNRQRAMMVMLAAIFAGWGSLLLLLLFRPSPGVFGRHAARLPKPSSPRIIGRGDEGNTQMTDGYKAVPSDRTSTGLGLLAFWWAVC